MLLAIYLKANCNSTNKTMAEENETEVAVAMDEKTKNRKFFVGQFKKEDIPFLVRALNKYSKDKSWNGLNIWNIYARWYKMRPRPNYVWLRAEIALAKKRG